MRHWSATMNMELRCKTRTYSSIREVRTGISKRSVLGRMLIDKYIFCEIKCVKTYIKVYIALFFDSITAPIKLHVFLVCFFNISLPTSYARYVPTRIPRL